MTRQPDNLDPGRPARRADPVEVTSDADPRPAPPIAGGMLPEPGRVLFGKYLVLHRLGGGAMGDVWLVRHLSLNREHALKVIVPGLASHPAALARFQREFRVMAAFRHAHAATIHDARLDAEGGYIDMEYIEGPTLRQVLDTARADRRPGRPLMPLGWTLGILGQLCDVLQCAHEAGIVHRDLKPANLMLLAGRPPGREFLKVCDFGIAKVRDDPDTALKTTGFLGTPAYASPEQATGDQVDDRADLYAVGLLLFEFLAGRAPFRGAGMEVLYQHAHAPPPTFSAIDPDLRVAPEIETVVRRCLAKRPEERPQTARQLFEEFREAVLRLDGGESGSDATEGDRPSDLSTALPATGSGDGPPPGTATPGGAGRSAEDGGPGRRRPGRVRGRVLAIAGVVSAALVLGTLAVLVAPALRREGEVTGGPAVQDRLRAILEDLRALPEETRVRSWELEARASLPGPLPVGTDFALLVRCGEPGHLVAYTVAAGGGVTFLFPNAHRPSAAVEADQEISIPHPDGLRIQPPVGRETYVVYWLEEGHDPFRGFPFGSFTGPLTVGPADAPAPRPILPDSRVGARGPARWDRVEVVVRSVADPAEDAHP